MRSILLLLALIAPLMAVDAVAAPITAAVTEVAALSVAPATSAAVVAPKRIPLAKQTGTPGQAWLYLGVIAGCSIVISLLVAGLIKVVAVTMNRSQKA